MQLGLLLGLTAARRGGGGVAPPEPLQQAAFSKTIQIGVPLSGVTVVGTEQGSAVLSNYPGVTIDDSVYPPVATGTPTAFGLVEDAIFEVNGARSMASPVTALEGAPVFTVLPVASSTYQVGGTYSTTAGTAPGATSTAFQIFRRLEGATGDGVAISPSAGGYLQTRAIPEADLGYEYSTRVRAFRGTLWAEHKTDWSTAVTEAEVGLPVFTTASSFSGTSGIGEPLIAVAGAGTGTASVQWVANDVAIPGATSFTYVQAWGDRYKSVKPVITRTNTAGAVADTAVLTPVVVSPKLTAAYFGSPSWYDGSTLRFMTKVLYTPYEPGKSGTPKVAASPTGARQRTFDHRVDFYLRGNLHWATPGSPINNLMVNGGGRNGVYWGFKQNGWKVQHTRANGLVSFISIGGAFNVFHDQIFYGGSESNANGGYQLTDIQGCYLPTRGWYANPFITASNINSGFNEATIEDVTRLNDQQVKITIDTATLPAGFRPPTAQTVSGTGKVTYTSYLILYGVEVSAGVINELNVDWNTNYEVVSYNSVTGEIIAIPNLIGDGGPSNFGPAVSASAVANTGKALVMSKVADFHSDGAQKGKGIAGPTRRHGNTYDGNYTAWGVDGINQNDSENAMYHTCENVRRKTDYNPQEYRAQLIYWGPQSGTVFEHEGANIFVENEWARVSFNQLVHPNTGVLSTVDGAPFLAYDGLGHPNSRGGVHFGTPPGGDYAPPDRDYWNYAPTFHGQRNPVNADMTGVTINGSTFTPEAATGTEIGQLLVTAPGWVDGLNDADGQPVIVDFVITGADAGKVSQGWSGLLYSTATTGSAAFTLQVTALVRDSATNYGAPVQFGPVPITITPA